MYSSSWQDADALEEELQEGQIRVQAEDAQRLRLPPRDQSERRVNDDKPSAIAQGSAGQKPQ